MLRRLGEELLLLRPSAAARWGGSPCRCLGSAEISAEIVQTRMCPSNMAATGGVFEVAVDQQWTDVLVEQEFVVERVAFSGLYDEFIRPPCLSSTVDDFPQIGRAS